MNLKEVIKTLELAKAEVEWNYPMDYAVAIDEAIKAIDKYDPPYCEHCSGGTSYEGCKACAEEHEREKNRGCMEQEG